jgi:hypothetical protein
VGVQPGDRGGPGTGRFEQADGDEQYAADPGDHPGVALEEVEHAHDALERDRDDQERDAKAEAVDEREERAARRRA